jgi:dihydroorotate dehydrogenase
LASSGELAAAPGGLSGAPLRTGTRGLVRRARSLVGDRLAIIASGGIGSSQDAATLIAAGADLVQLWSGLVYAGPGLIGETTKAATKAGGRAEAG